VKRLVVVCVVLAACGDNTAPISYSNPQGGKLRLVQTSRNGNVLTLGLFVGDAPLTGFSTGFDLPLDVTRVKLTNFTPGTALDPGPAPLAAKAVIGNEAPLAGTLVVGQSQKATAHASDAQLAAGSELLEIELTKIEGAPDGTVFDGTATDFALPSGGLMDRMGNVVVAPNDVAIGKLVVNH
jgi:hypothetical protein